MERQQPDARAQLDRQGALLGRCVQERACERPSLGRTDRRLDRGGLHAIGFLRRAVLSIRLEQFVWTVRLLRRRDQDLQPLAVQRDPVTEPVSSLDRPSNESKSVLPDEFVTRLFFSSRRVRIRSGLTPLAVCSVLAMLSGCAVYDSSLLSDTGSPLANGGESSLGGFADAGGAPGGASNGGSANAGDPPAFDDAGAGGDPSAQGGAGGAATAGASASAGKNSGGSAQGGSAQAGSAQAGSAQAGAAQAGSSGTAGASGVDSPRDLTTGKSATASTQQTGNEIEKGNDGNSSTRWCGKDDSLPQWWRVDLGASHQLSSFSVSFQIATRAYTYDIETSPDDKVYTRRLTITGTGAVQTGDFPAGVNARYVRITVTKAEPFANGATVWASFYEFSVLGI